MNYNNNNVLCSKLVIWEKVANAYSVRENPNAISNGVQVTCTKS